MDHLSRSRLNLFSSITTDRTARTLGDPCSLMNLENSNLARFLPVCDTKVLVTDDEHGLVKVMMKKAELIARFRNITPPIYLCYKDNLHFFSVGVDGSNKEINNFVDLRKSAESLSDVDAALLGYALAMLTWQCNHQYCGACGSVTIAKQAGHILKCTNKTCNREHYPRSDPAIIVLVEHKDRALFGRKTGWPIGRFSTIAGFVEPGESVEQAVVREVAEETGVEVIETHYHSSQPWPFPCSLMLGFSGRAGHADIHLNDKELQEATWLSREEFASQLKCGDILPPTPTAISFRLMEDWFNRDSEISLRLLCENNNKLR